MTGFGQIDWSRWRLTKCSRKGEYFIVEFDAPAMGGGPFETWQKKINTDFLLPHPDMMNAFAPLRMAVLRLFDWPGERADQVHVTGIELKHDPAGDYFEVSFRFVFLPENIPGEMEIMKTLPLTSMHGLANSLTETELGHLADCIEEVRLYVSRQKGAQGDLFSEKAVVDMNVN